MIAAEALTNPFRRDRLNGPEDYVPEWDVPSIASDVTNRLLGAIESTRGRTKPDPSSKVHVLLSPPGYGKTHLFGRIAHRIDDDVLFLFIPAIEDLRRPLEHIRWWVVENVFRRRGDRPGPLPRALCTLCQPSFLAYMDELPATLATRYVPLRERIARDHLALLDVASSASDLDPFLRLASSINDRFPDLDGDIVRALTLGWSPAAGKARRWLRGEALPEDQADQLDLPDEPPEPIAVIRAIATFLSDHSPVVLCLDQLDVLLKDRDQAPLRLSTDLMTILASVPNLVCVLSCLEVDWRLMTQPAPGGQGTSGVSGAFLDRIREHKLDLLKEDQVFELLRRRLTIWPDRPPEKESPWPFTAQAIRHYSFELPPFPRSTIKDCETAFERWMEAGDIHQEIHLIKDGQGPKPIDVLFRDRWEEELKRIRADRNKTIENVQDQRLWRALHEALELYHRKSNQSPSGRPAIGAFGKDPPVPQQGNGIPYRYSREIVLKGVPNDVRLILAFEAAHNGRNFHFYFDAVEKLLTPAARVCFVTTKPELPAGKVVQQRMDQRAERGELRVVSLREFRDDVDRLECFLALLDDAEKGDLTLGGTAITPKGCRDLAEKTEALENLVLITQLLDGWVIPPEVPAAAEAPEIPTPAHAEIHPVQANGKHPTPVVPAGSAANGSTDDDAPASNVEPSPSQVGSMHGDGDDRVAWAADREDIIIKTLGDFSVKVRAKGVSEIGPTFARFLIDPLTTPINKIRNRAEDLKIRLGVEALPLINSQAGAVSVDVQLPDEFRRVVRLGDVGPSPKKAGRLDPVWPVGQDVSGKTYWLDFADSNDCHLLVAGTTGSGKSEFLKVMIGSLARRLGPKNVRFLLVDPKRVTFNFKGTDSPFLLRPVAYESDEALDAVRECFEETERRYKMLQERHLTDLAQLQAGDPKAAPPRIVIVFDEFADLMADKAYKEQLEKPLKKLSAKARAAGIHLVLATQRPEASVVTPLLRSNLPSRICLRVSSKADSHLILQSHDGAALLGKGDLLWRRGAGLLRLQSPFVEADELEAILFPQVAVAV